VREYALENQLTGKTRKWDGHRRWTAEEKIKEAREQIELGRFKRGSSKVLNELSIKTPGVRGRGRTQGGGETTNFITAKHLLKVNPSHRRIKRDKRGKNYESFREPQQKKRGSLPLHLLTLDPSTALMLVRRGVLIMVVSFGCPNGKREEVPTGNKGKWVDSFQTNVNDKSHRKDGTGVEKTA